MPKKFENKTKIDCYIHELPEDSQSIDEIIFYL